MTPHQMKEKIVIPMPVNMDSPLRHSTHSNVDNKQSANHPVLSHPSHSHLTPDTPSIIIPLSRTIQFYILYIWGPVTAQLTSFFLLVSITVYSIICLKSNIGLPYPNIFFSNFHQIFIKALYTPYKSRPCNPPHNPETPVLIGWFTILGNHWTFSLFRALLWHLNKDTSW